MSFKPAVLFRACEVQRDACGLLCRFVVQFSSAPILAGDADGILEEWYAFGLIVRAMGERKERSGGEGLTDGTRFFIRLDPALDARHVQDSFL